MLFVVVLAAAGWCRAQERLVVEIDTNLPEAMLFADSLRLGPAAVGTFLVPARTRRLRLMPPDLDAWSIAPVTASLPETLADTLVLRLHFPYHYQVESVPFGASVFVETLDGRAALGETPLLHKAPQPLDGMLVVELQGYRTEERTPGREVWNRYVLTLQPLQLEEEPSAELAWQPPPRRRLWIDVAAAAVAVAGGALTIHYKFKADRLNDRYRQTGDPALRARIKDLDTRAGVALGTMQVGVGVLAVRFILK